MEKLKLIPLYDLNLEDCGRFAPVRREELEATQPNPNTIADPFATRLLNGFPAQDSKPHEPRR